MSGGFGQIDTNLVLIELCDLIDVNRFCKDEYDTLIKEIMTIYNDKFKEQSERVQFN